MKKIASANIELGVSRTLSGLNVNALRYLLPTWMSPMTGVMFRLTFGAIAFWALGAVAKNKPQVSRRMRVFCLVLGAVCIYTFMMLYLMGISRTSPVVACIFSSFQPVFVFIISIVFLRHRATWRKVTGISIALAGALLCVFTQHGDGHNASNALMGDIYLLLSALIYAAYLVVSKELMRYVDADTLIKYTFTGGAIASVLALPITGFHAPMFTAGIHWLPICVLAFVLVFPTVISYFLIEKALQWLSATVVAIYGYLMLIVASIVSFILGQDRFSWYIIAAIVLIMIGVYMVEKSDAEQAQK